jgi:putative ABC transport system ATP-binding protein
MSRTCAIALESVSKIYGRGRQAVPALTDVTLRVESGEFVSMMGPSGSGKSTLLGLLAGLETPSAGRVSVAGADLATLSENDRSDLRLRRIGIVFQSFNLFPTFTAEENVAWPLEFLGVPWRTARTRAAAVLESVGIAAEGRRRRPVALSGGEQQRVAIARALVTEPEVLLADEPTGNLDSRTGQTILGLLRERNAMTNLTVIMATHGAVAAAYGHRIVELGDGRVVRETRTGNGGLGARVLPFRV